MEREMTKKMIIILLKNKRKLPFFHVTITRTKTNSVNSTVIIPITLNREEEDELVETQRCQLTVLRKFWGGYDKSVFSIFPTYLTLDEFG